MAEPDLSALPVPIRLDERGCASLDGVWEFYPGDVERSALETLAPQPIAVPGLWEAQGHLELDGVAWYRLRFQVGAADGKWTLRFAAVMDPVNAADDRERLLRYRELARREPNVWFGGRLGTYRYLDMHMAIAAALSFVDNELTARLR